MPVNSYMWKFLLALALGASSLSVLAEEFKYPYTAGERDPFAPAVNERGDIVIREAASGLSDITLQGIMYSPGASAVVINKDIYREGDYIGKYHIKKIDQNSVTLENDGKEYFIKWGG